MSDIKFSPILHEVPTDSTEFIGFALNCFRSELNFYIEKNNDPTLLGYCNEQTMTSLLLMGLVREDQQISGLQEYSLYRQDEPNCKKPDLFVKFGEEAFWIESKMDRTYKAIDHENHWDIAKWMAWDQAAFEQAQGYYDIEKSTLNKLYPRHFLMTLCFKTLKENPGEYLSTARKNLRSELNTLHRSWFYDCIFLDHKEEGKNFGIEVYGTWRKVN